MTDKLRPVNSLMILCFIYPALAGGLTSIKNDPGRSFTYFQKQPQNISEIITRSKAGKDRSLIAVFFSGDGGWHSFEQAIADDLANMGISTIGIDTKKYFWNRKSPEITASDISGLLKYYGTEWKVSHYILMGYSYGAEIVPFVLNRLPAELKQKVNSAIMLSPESSTDFELHVSNMVGIGSSQNIYNVIKEIREVKGTRQILIFGNDEKTQVPELLKNSHLEIVKIPGDHHYNRNASLIVETMINKKAF